jgi:hypothetical protein
MRRTGAAAGTVAALGAAGLFAAGKASAAIMAGSGTRGLAYPSGVADTSHCTPEVAAIFRGFFSAKSEHDTAVMMSYFSPANTTYIDACLGVALTSWQAVNREFSTFAKLPAAAISYPLRIVGDTRSAAIEFADAPAFFGQEISRLTAIYDSSLLSYTAYQSLVGLAAEAPLS